MLRRLNGALLVSVLLCLAGQSLPSRAEDLPIIVTYELRKARVEARVAARDPKRFWTRQVFNRIESKIVQLPNSLKAPVTVRLSFAVGHDGRLVSKAISTPSGDPAADKAAMAMLERAAPFPPMPETMTDQAITFVLPVRFK